MKRMKRIGVVLLALCFFVPCIRMTAYAADGSIAFSDPSTEVGEMVEIKCVVRSSVGSLGNVEIQLSYDSAALRFGSGEGVTASGDGALTCSSAGGSSEITFNMTFQALAEGSTKVTVSGAAVSSDGGAGLSVEEGDSTVTIGPGDPSKIQEDSGTTAVPSAEDLQVEVNGEAYILTDGFADADIPSGYTRTSVTLNGQERQMVMNEAGSIYLGYLLDAQNMGDFFLYNQENATFAPYEEVRISDKTSIVILSDSSKVNLPDTYAEAELTLNEKKFPIWQDNEHPGYYVMYAMNNSGEAGYYQYHEAEGTYQKVEITAGEQKEEAEDDSFTGKIRSFLDENIQMVVLAAGLGSIVVLILIIILAVKLRNRNLELDDLYDEYGIDAEEEGEMPAAKAKTTKAKKTAEKAEKTAAKPKSRSVRSGFGEDDFEAIDLDDFDDDFDDFGDFGDGFDDFDAGDFEEDEFEEKFEEDGFEESPQKDSLDGDDFEDSFDEDIFSEEKIGKYDTVNVYQKAPVSGVSAEDDLDDILGGISEKKPKKRKEDSFDIDFIDLD